MICKKCVWQSTCFDCQKISNIKGMNCEVNVVKCKGFLEEDTEPNKNV